MNKDIADPTERVREYLDNLVAPPKQQKIQQLPGIQYTVITADSVLFNYAGGVCDASTGKKVTDTTKFLSSSCTKVLTAAAVLKLVEADKVNLDDSLSKHYKDHPYGDDLKIRHLLNQSSGIPNPMPLRWLHTREEHDAYSESAALAAAMEAHPKLGFEPGERYAYCNLSYWLLGKVIESASGMSYKEYMRTEIFQPLGISEDEMSFDILVRNEEQSARGHQERWSLLSFAFYFLADGKIWDKPAGKWARFKVLYMNAPAYGGARATSVGYAKFLQDMLQPVPRLFSGSDTKDIFFSEQRDGSGKLMPTTLGWHRGQLGEHTYYGKPGGGPGYSSNIRVYPKEGIATVYLANKTQVSEGPINDLSDALDAEFLGMFGQDVLR